VMSPFRVTLALAGKLSKFSGPCKRSKFFFIMAPQQLTLGKDAVVAIDLRYIHPSELIRNKFPNRQQGDRLENCRVTGLESLKVNKKEQLVVTFHHDDFKDDNGSFSKLYAVKRWAKVTSEGPPEFFFTGTQGQEAAEALPAAEEPLPAVVIDAMARARIDLMDMGDLAGVVDIDDDNEPAPENLPGPSQVSDVAYQNWGHSGICNRRQAGATNIKAKINIFSRDVIPSYLQLFEVLFPVRFVKEVMIPEMNKKLQPELKYGEFLKWLGLWFLMATTNVENRRDFWSTKPIDNFDSTHIRLGEYMSRFRFENILKALTFTAVAPPAYLDRFWEVRQLISEWNSNMDENFSASWISCVDESMSKWVNQFTCPGFIVCPRKPWPFGNEYHTISCGMTNILYRVDLVEGKDEPRQVPKKYAEYGKTIGTVLRLAQPLFGSSKCIVADSAFCIVKCIVELRKKGVFMSALIKKRRYWPRGVDGDGIINHFIGKDVGSVDALPGVFDGTPFHIYCMKEPDYAMSIMSTYGTLERVGKVHRRDFKDGGGKRQKTFSYPEVIFNHYQYRNSVDANNRDRMYPIALEEVWKTFRWPCRVFQFLLAVTEVNV